MKKYIAAILIAFTIIGAGCEDYVKGVSEFDPTLPRDASLGQVINAMEVALIGFAEGDVARLAGIFTSQFSGADRQYVSYNNYVVTAQDFDSQWGNIYANIIKSSKIAQEKATELNDRRARGLAKIIEGYTIGMTAALWGDVPYEESVNIEEFENPQFETQLEVYEHALRLLDEGVADINAEISAGISRGFTGDIFGGGSDDAWIQRANTIRAKFLLHLDRFDEAALAAQDGIASPDNELRANHGASYLQNFNIYYSFLTYDRPGYMTADNAFAPAILDPTNDLYSGDTRTNEAARFWWYYYPGGLNAAVNEYDVNVLSANEPGFAWGVDPGGAEDGFFAVDAEFPIVSYAENQLILAEALLRSNDAPGALTALNDWRAVLNTGYLISDAWVAEGLQYDPYLITDFAPGGTANPGALTTEDALYREIIQEKYLALLGNIEVFNDMRRYGFGSFTGEQNWEVIGITPNTGTTLPQRFLIPQTEINSNTSTPSDLGGLFEETPVFGQAPNS